MASVFDVLGRDHIEVKRMPGRAGERAGLPEGDQLAGKATAPTRPHPHTPPSPGVLKAAGPAEAAADRARDVVTHRDE